MAWADDEMIYYGFKTSLSWGSSSEGGTCRLDEEEQSLGLEWGAGCG